MRNTNNAKVFWQPQDMWRPEHNLELGGKLVDLTLGNKMDTVDVTSSDGVMVMPTMISWSVDLTVYDPSNDTLEIGSGDDGIIIVELTDGRTLHAKGIVEASTLTYPDYELAEAKYSFIIYQLQWGSITMYVLRVGMGDGTYRELLMTEKEREMFNPSEFRERQLVKSQW